jgi:hypothetical protein
MNSTLDISGTFGVYRNSASVIIATIQPTIQNKTKQLGWCGIIISQKNPPPPHQNDSILSLPGNLGS